MSVRLTQVPQNNDEGLMQDPIGYETTFDGQTYFWAPGQTRAFNDDNIGIGHANNAGSGSPQAGVLGDNEASGKKYPYYASRS